MSTPTLLIASDRAATATASSSSCAIEPTIPAGQIGFPSWPRKTARSAQLSRRSNSCATRRPAPVAARALCSRVTMEAPSAGRRYCSSPARTRRQPVTSPGGVRPASACSTALSMSASSGRVLTCRPIRARQSSRHPHPVPPRRNRSRHRAGARPRCPVRSRSRRGVCGRAARSAPAPGQPRHGRGPCPFAAVDHETVDDRLVIVVWSAVHQESDDAPGRNDSAGEGLVILPGLFERVGIRGDEALLLGHQLERQDRRPVVLADRPQDHLAVARPRFGRTRHCFCPISIARASIGVTTP